MIPIYLASKSPQRKDLLRAAGIPFRVTATTYREELVPGSGPVRLALRHAQGKAKGARVPSGPTARRAGGRAGVVIGADTVVACGGKVWGKPEGRSQAFRMLRFFSGKSQWVITGVALRDAATGRTVSFHVRSRVVFRRMTDADIRSYLDRGEYRGKAGSFGLQGKGARFIRKVEGSRSNIIGLPMERLLKELRSFQLSLRGA